MKNKIYELTQPGILKLKKELTFLKEVKRKENLEALKEAREQGDLSENADYDAARNEQALIEYRITEIQNILKNVRVVKVSKDKEINIGKKVSLKMLNSGTEEEFELVSTLESDPFSNKISIESPLGKKIKGHEIGDVVFITSETGTKFKVKILDVK
ncbi:Transcription elongation factor [Candidatus Phytoplasma australiense]|uniref:Transcription elongation factor GreA n=2 Tax=Phytoplasma australiense TaxID=59748 RepID=B1VA67_PHYAS|nr:transcription elongation factor GreA [Candidatus Phytoplasma australiense]AGL90214.1 Transcription elongation factor greA [Strawberry lethal yellows phytoplasma (CPA) str. NZSb11]CAM11840.1 Transcription elongation factor [Candidatus Phytoplasma australiense]